MKILLDNVNTQSTSGPNSFGKRLIDQLNVMGHDASTEHEYPDVQLAFINFQDKKAPLTALRLDGIYFNTQQDWNSLNGPIKKSFNDTDLVIYQTNFNKVLTEKFFGTAKKFAIINNGTCFDAISKIDPIQNSILDNFSEVWSCASSWRPHKRLSDNIRYFLEKSPPDSCLVIAGDNPDVIIKHPRVFYAGKLSWKDCIALYKRSKVFLHLAFLDHCPNVVVDARAAGCQLVISSSGGTKEIAGPGAKIIDDISWDLSPLDLYSPPDLDFKNFRISNIESDIDIKNIAKKYVRFLSNDK